VEECDSEKIADEESDQQADDGAWEKFHWGYFTVGATLQGKQETPEIYSLTATMISEIMS
jgi:hypothetical protein